METLTDTLNGIARRHNIVPRDDDKPKPRTPDHSADHKMCVSCHNGPILVDGICEPCYRTHHINPIKADNDKLIRRMSVNNASLVEHEDKLSRAKIQYNLAVKQNHRCIKCGQVYSYYGDLFAHEKSNECRIRTKAGIRRSATVREEDLI